MIPKRNDPIDDYPDSSEGRPPWASTGLWLTLQRFAGWVAQHELWILAAAAPFLLFPSRWTVLAFSVIVASWLCRWIAQGRLSVPTPGDAPIALLLFTTAIGLYASVDPSSSLAGLWRIVLGVAVFYGLANGLRSEARRRWLPIVLIFCSLALALVTLIGTEWASVRLLRLPQIYEHLPRWIRDIQDQNAFHPRIMGMALATWLPIPLALLLFSRNKRQRAWAGLAVLVMGLTLLLTQSLQATVGVACAVLFLAVCWNRRFLLTVPLLLGALLLGLRMYGPQQAAKALLSLDHPLGIAVVLRLDMWSRALAMIHDMPYTGIGLDTFPVIQSQFYPGVMIGPEPHAHNLFLQLALDLGLPGLFAFLWLLVSLGYAAFNAYRKCSEPDTRALLLGAVGGAVSYVASGLLDTIWTAKPSVLLWFILGLFAAVSAAVARSDEPRASRRLPAWVHRTTPLFLLLVLLIPGLLVTRAGPALNLATVRAHKLLLSAQAGQGPSRQALSSLAEELTEVARVDVDNAHVHSLLGRVLAWQGEYAAAIEAFHTRVQIDGKNATARYDPSESLRRRLLAQGGPDQWEDTVRIYSQWTSRFPQRAEHYVLIALVRDRHQDNPRGAAAVLNSGIERGAEPQGLLLYYLETMQKPAEAAVSRIVSRLHSDKNTLLTEPRTTATLHVHGFQQRQSFSTFLLPKSYPLFMLICYTIAK